MIKRGDSGLKVEVLQIDLQSAGWDIDVHGDFCYETEAALRCHQTRAKITVDGIAGPETFDSLLGYESNPLHEKTDPINWCYDSVAYFSQRDNMLNPKGSCGPTSLAMVLDYWGWEPDGDSQPDDYITAQIRKRGGFANIHRGMTWFAQEARFQSFFKALSWDEIDYWGRYCGPMIAAGSFTPPGHIVVIVGRTAIGDLIVHDPWGDWTTGYLVKDGAFRIYPFNKMKKILQAFKGDTSKAWIHQISL